MGALFRALAFGPHTHDRASLLPNLCCSNMTLLVDMGLASSVQSTENSVRKIYRLDLSNALDALGDGENISLHQLGSEECITDHQ